MTFIGGQDKELTLREIIRRLEDVYCQTIGLEYMYINSYEKCNWIRQRFEDPARKKLDIKDVERAVKRLIRASKYKRNGSIFDHLPCFDLDSKIISRRNGVRKNALVLKVAKF